MSHLSSCYQCFSKYYTEREMSEYLWLFLHGLDVQYDTAIIIENGLDIIYNETWIILFKYH